MPLQVEVETVAKLDLKLPTMPGVASKLLDIFQNGPSASGLEKAGKVISLDAPLSAKLLRAANAAPFGINNNVSSIDDAIERLGPEAVKSIALSFSLTAGFRPPRGSPFTYSRFWKDSLTTAVAARAISARVKPEDANPAFFCGLLHDIGSLILSESFPQEYIAIVEESHRGSVPLGQAESNNLGLDHTVVGEFAVQQWRLPDFFAAPIRFHHLPEAFEGPVRERILTQILHLASLFVDAFRSGGCETQQAAIRRYSALCGLDGIIDPAAIARQISVEVQSSFPLFDTRIDTCERIRILEATREALADVSQELIVQVKKQFSAIEQLKQQSTTDGLTKIYNQRHFVRTLKHEIERAQRHATPLSLVMGDIDKFKLVNDFHGHLTGDYVLQTIASRLKETLRGSDYLARYGGEEFAAILPQTSLHEASQVTERLRDAVRSKPVSYNGKSLSVTMSFGIAAMELNRSIELEGFIHMADEALYQAKNSGRDRCCIYRHATFEHNQSVVLIADDEAVVLETLSKMLERLGFGVIEARDGDEALSLFHEHGDIIDTVILDVMMPGISTREVFYEIKAASEDVRIFLSSGYTADEVGKNMLARCEGFLAKPYTIHDLSKKLHAAAGGRRSGFRQPSAAEPAAGV